MTNKPFNKEAYGKILMGVLPITITSDEELDRVLPIVENLHFKKDRTPEEAAPLLWVPRVIDTLAADRSLGLPEKVSRYGIGVVVDTPSQLVLGTAYTTLLLIWCPIDKYSHTAVCKVLLKGIDDTHYGAWLTSRTHEEFVDTWALLRQFLEDCGAREYGLNGTYLIEYCKEHLGAYERDYN